MATDRAYEFDREWKLFVDGEFRSGSDRLPVENPATGEVFAEAAAGGTAEVDDAVAAARSAFEEWQWVDPIDRAAKLREVADAIEAHEEELVMLETAENGKPLYQSRNDVQNAAATFRYYAGGADKFYGDTVSYDPDEMRQTVYEPYGVVGVVIPWNWPPMHTADFTAVALATGNSVVLKPAPDTPLSSLRIAELAQGILPDGLLNVIPGGVEPGVALTTHDDVDKVAFTGSDENGAKVLEATAEDITSAMMELGGKNPAIVFPDADIEKAISGVVRNAFYNGGQACSGTERLLLHEDIADEFRERFATAVEDLVVGDGSDDATQVGPLVNGAQLERVEAAVEASDRPVLARASTPDDPELEGGYWFPPTVLDEVEPDDDIAQEEVFGPVVAVTTFSDEAEALELANGVEYGLTAAVWTTDHARATSVARRIEAGVVAINNPSRGGLGTPFGGYKRSGMGRKKDFTNTMREFSQVKTIRADLTDDHFSL